MLSIVERAKKLMRDLDIDGWLVVSSDEREIHSPWILGVNCYSKHFIFIPRNGDPFVLISNMEAPMVREFSGIKNVIGYENYGDMRDKLSKYLQEIKGSKIALNYVDDLYNSGGESLNTLTYGDYLSLKGFVKGVEFVSAKKLLYLLRSKKSREEIENHKVAADIAVKAMKAAIETIAPGVSESEVAAEAESVMRRNGAEIAFKTIVASGKNSADPHHNTSRDKLIKDGELVIVDLGARYKMQCSDMTWTVFVGKNPPKKAVKMFEAVLKAKTSAISKIKPGVEAWMIDEAARKVIHEYGFTDNEFMHSTGHPLGIEVHDVGPSFSKRDNRETATIKMEPGMIMTVEPGVYMREFGGVRLEDDVVVTEDGCEVTTESLRELIELT
ncbi:MAG: M24 family metallopeptidase [Candidatus Asgardarchaeia archaeon]